MAAKFSIWPRLHIKNLVFVKSVGNVSFIDSCCFLNAGEQGKSPLPVITNLNMLSKQDYANFFPNCGSHRNVRGSNLTLLFENMIFKLVKPVWRPCTDFSSLSREHFLLTSPKNLKQHLFYIHSKIFRIFILVIIRILKIKLLNV